MENKLKAAARLLEVMDTLREKCPWDREQTHQTIRRDLLEETYELIEGIDKNDPEILREELGDVLLQVVLRMQLPGTQGRLLKMQILLTSHHHTPMRYFLNNTP